MSSTTQPSAAEIHATYVDLARRAKEFQERYGDIDPKERLSIKTQAEIQHQWAQIRNRAVLLRYWVLETRAIPKGKAKAVELAFRAFEVERPRNILTWWHKNMRHLTTLLQSGHWPERTASPVSEIRELVEVGPFVVHNTVHLTGSKLDRTLEVIADAARDVSASDRVLSQVLYGPVYIVGRLRSPRALAWYYKGDDTIYVRPMPKSTYPDRYHLIHELGHRFWERILDREQRAPWATRHRRLQGLPVDVESPKIGDPLPIVGKDAPAIITGITYPPGRRGPYLSIDSGGYVSYAAVHNAREREARAKLFPSTYSMTHVEEHFAEAFAMHVLGMLEGEHEAFFQSWLDTVQSRAPNALRQRLCAAY